MNRIGFAVVSLTRTISRNFLGVNSTVEHGTGLFNPINTLQVRGKKYGMEYQPNNLQRKRKHGYLKRTKTEGGRKVLERRIAKGRKWLSH